MILDALLDASVGEFHLDALLAALRVEPGRILEAVVAGQQGARLAQQRRALIWRHPVHQVGVVGDDPLPRGIHQRQRGIRDPVTGGQAVELLERGVHHRAAQLRGRRGFGQPVDRAEPVEQRALLEIGRPRR